MLPFSGAIAGYKHRDAVTGLLPLAALGEGTVVGGRRMETVSGAAKKRMWWEG